MVDHPTGHKSPYPSPIKRGSSRRLLDLILWVLAFGTVTIVLFSIAFALSQPDSGTVRTGTDILQRGLQAFTTIFAIAGTSLAAGGLFGFLLGIPNADERNSNSTITSSNTGDTNSNNRNIYQENDSLEQISDWLTKILLGAGLSQIASLGKALVSLENRINNSIDITNSIGFFGVTIFLTYLVSGFIGGYLWARFNVRTALAQRDNRLFELSSIRADVDTVDRGLKNVRSELKEDVDVALVLQEIFYIAGPYPERDTQEVIRANLTRKLLAASPQARLDTFKYAQEMHANYWERDKGQIEKTIPVLKALIDAEEKEPVFNELVHRLQAELGLALKDRFNPTREDFLASQQYLEAAIRIRNENEEDWSPNVRPWLAYYEFNYAFNIFALANGTDIESPEVKQTLEDYIRIVAKASLFDRIFASRSRSQPLLDLVDWIRQKNLHTELGFALPEPEESAPSEP